MECLGLAGFACICLRWYVLERQDKYQAPAMSCFDPDLLSARGSLRYSHTIPPGLSASSQIPLWIYTGKRGERPGFGRVSPTMHRKIYGRSARKAQHVRFHLL